VCQPIDSNGRTIWIADAHRGDGKRFVVRADEKLTAFIKLQSSGYRLSRPTSRHGRPVRKPRHADVAHQQ
jgi:hypothetical protein